MTPALSANTQAILLLTAPLIAGRNTAASGVLSPGEYKRLARHLRDIRRQPADLISAQHATETLRACQPVIDEGRLQSLLGRGFLLSQAVDRWHRHAIWVISRADSEYPRRLKARLREDAPAILYGCGDRNLLNGGGFAVVGSRQVHSSLVDYTKAIGRLSALAGKTLVSGGARGIDQAAMHGALEAGGKVCGVLADSLEKTALQREQRNLLLNGQSLLISPSDPNAGFHVGRAMQRNKLIYALADSSLVVNSDLNKGGTWAGATEQLDKFRFGPVFVRSTGQPSTGLDGLRKKGALSWPEPQDLASFEDLFKMTTATAATKARPVPDPLPTSGASKELSSVAPRNAVPMDKDKDSAQSAATPAEMLFAGAQAAIGHLLSQPMKDAEIAAALEVSKTQARTWLQRLVDEGVLERKQRPAGYIVKPKPLCESPVSTAEELS